MKSHARRIVVSVMSVVALCVGLLATDIQPAMAATRTVSITVADWNCMLNGKYKGKVTKVLIDATPSSSGAAKWVSGRTRTGVKVIYNPSGSAVTIAAVAYCKTGLFSGYYRELANGRWVTSNSPSSNSWTI